MKCEQAVRMLGIGHVYYNGIHYWVEEFANRSSINTTETTANDSKQNVSVEILNSNIEEIEVPLEKDDYWVKVGNRTAVKMSSDSNVIVKVSDHWPSGKAPITDIPQLGVADSSVATYSNGELTGIKEGTTNLTAKLGNKVFYLPSEVSVHDLEKIEAKNATYTKLGNKEYYKCKVCKKLYLDVNGEKETTLKEVTIPVLPKKNQTITGTKSSYTKTYGNAKFSLGAKAKGKLTYKSDKESVATVSQSGVVTIKGAGTAKIKITAAATTEYNSSVKTVTISVKKASPSITIKSADAKKTISYSKVKKKAQSFQLKVSVNSKVKLTYKKISGNSKFSVGNTGKVTVAKGVKKGSYALKIKVSALAKGNYNAGSKTIKVTVTVK